MGSRTLHLADAIHCDVAKIALRAGTGIGAGAVHAAGVLAEEAALSGSEGNHAVRRSAGGAGAVSVAGGAGRQAGDALIVLRSGSHHESVPAIALGADSIGGANLAVIDLAGDALAVGHEF